MRLGSSKKKLMLIFYDWHLIPDEKNPHKVVITFGDEFLKIVEVCVK